MKKFIAGLVMLVASCTANAGWSNVYTDYNASKGNNIVGIEGSIGSVYGFAEQDLTDHTTFAKVVNNTVLTNEINLYTQGSYFNDGVFDEQQLYMGLSSTVVDTPNANVSTWVGYGLINNTFDYKQRTLAGLNAYVNLDHGWAAHTWNEIGLEETTLNGAMTIQKDLTPKFYSAATYRYMYNDAGFDGFNNEVIFKLGYRL